jgi:NAD(P)-dependent dehydrogenase (short-subunit alcohol dehydrogenase family)
MGKLKGKVAFVIGGAAGIGAATAQFFAEEGAKLIIMDDNEEFGLAFEQELKSQNVEAIFIKGDKDAPLDINDIYRIAKDTFGKVDIIFHNAYIGWNTGKVPASFETKEPSLCLTGSGPF